MSTVEANGGAAAAPAWLREYLLAQTGPTHTIVLKLEPFVAWLGAAEPASVAPVALLDLFAFWTQELGAARSRIVLEAVRDLYAWLRESGVAGAGQLLGITDDYLRHPRAVAKSGAGPAKGFRGFRLRGGLADVFAACGVMLISVVLVAGGWLMSRPATIVGGSGYGPALPLVLSMALGAPFLFGGYVLLLQSARRLGTMSLRTGLWVMGGVGLLSLVFCIAGIAGALASSAWAASSSRCLSSRSRSPEGSASGW